MELLEFAGANFVCFYVVVFFSGGVGVLILFLFIEREFRGCALVINQ